MIILTRPIIVLLALWCTAVLLVPGALGADLGTGGMQAPGGSEHGNNPMQAPPSGGHGTSGAPGGNDRQGSANGDAFTAPPSGGMERGNMTATGGPGSRQGNRNMTPAEFSDMTASELRGGAGMNGDGNMTPPDFGNLSAGNFTPRDGIRGNSTELRHSTSNQSIEKMNAPDNLPSDGIPGQDVGRQSVSQSSGQDQQVQQQSKEDVIASLITQLQTLLSGKK